MGKDELAAKDAEIKKLKRRLHQSKVEIEDLKSETILLETKVQNAEEKNIVLVPSDPHYMLGLQAGHSNRAEEKAKNLMKILHPDRSGSNETAYLFDMILKARNQILK